MREKNRPVTIYYVSPEALKLLSLIYEEYLYRTANGESPTDAKAFGTGEQLKAYFGFDCPLIVISEWCKELHDLGLVNAIFSYETGLVGVYLLNYGIDYLNKIKKGIYK